jgi:GntR family transcriptional regulator
LKPLDRISGIPLYLQIRNIIQQEILSGEIETGEQIPSEDELAKSFGVSRMTVRQGLSELLSDGILYKQHGVGTFVSQTHISANYSKLTSFTLDAVEQGKKPGAKLLAVERQQAKGSILQSLGLEGNSLVVCIKRLRFADGLPVAIQESYVPEDICPVDIESYDWSKQSLFELMESNGHVPMRATETISAVTASEENAKLLDLKVGSPLIYIERVTFDSRGMPIEFVIMVNRPDRYKCAINLFRQK